MMLSMTMYILPAYIAWRMAYVYAILMANISVTMGAFIVK